jgi:hypothetical protein
MKYFGFYDGLSYKVGAHVPVGDLQRSMQWKGREGIAGYMDECEALVVVPGVESDPIDGSRNVMGGGGLRTDGEWIWPVMANHMVREYGLILPGEFLEKVVSFKYRAPALTLEEIIELFKKVKPDLW